MHFAKFIKLRDMRTVESELYYFHRWKTYSILLFRRGTFGVVSTVHALLRVLKVSRIINLSDMHSVRFILKFIYFYENNIRSTLIDRNQIDNIYSKAFYIFHFSEDDWHDIEDILHLCKCKKQKQVTNSDKHHAITIMAS